MRAKMYLLIMGEDSLWCWWMHLNKISRCCQSFLRSLQTNHRKSSWSVFQKNTKISSSNMWCPRYKKTMKQSMITKVSMRYQGKESIATLRQHSKDSKHQSGLNQQNIKSPSVVYQRYKWVVTWCLMKAVVFNYSGQLEEVSKWILHITLYFETIFVFIYIFKYLLCNF